MPATVTSGPERWANVHLNYEPFPKQNRFHGSAAKYRLFGGAAGPGKSKALLFEAVLQAHENPGANVLVLRRTFPELEQSLLQYFRRDVTARDVQIL
jgi:phage terminase large subunit